MRQIKLKNIMQNNFSDLFKNAKIIKEKNIGRTVID